jgi:hypothetical protein
MRLSRRAIGLLILAAGVMFAALFIFKIQNGMADFEVNYKAGKRLWLNETLYRTVDEHYQFKYSPFSAALYLPLAFLPLPVAKGVWYAIVLFSIAWLLYLSSKLTDRSGRQSLVQALVPGVILAKFFLRELQLGQINALITAILVFMTYVLVKEETAFSAKQEISAGLLWGLAMSLKPYALIFFPYFILKKKWQSLWPGFLFLALSLFVPTVFYGWSGNMVVLKEWSWSLSHSTPGLLNSQDNVSLLAFLVKWTGKQNLSILFFAVALGCLALLVFFFIQKGKESSRPLVLDAALLLVLIPLISPLGWDYTFLSSILAVALVVKEFDFFPRAAKILLVCNFLIIALSIYDILGRKLYAAFMSRSVLTIDFLILVAALFYLRSKGRR